MATQRIGYSNKSRGDLWTAQEANEVKAVVNNNANEVDSLAQSVANAASAVSNMGGQISAQQATINALGAAQVTWQQTTEEDMADMIEDQTWLPNVIYYTEES